MPLAKELLHILQHSLGLDQYGNGIQYRHYYVAGPDDAEKCRELVKMGYMTERLASEITGGDPCFLVTRSGINAVAAESPKPPKRTRSQRRYKLYLRCDVPETYGEWMKNHYYDECRKQHGV